MAIPCYLALTAGEFANIRPLPKNTAYMACHFSCYGAGLSNLPATLPVGSLLTLNDRTPVFRHDPEQILSEMLAAIERLAPSGVLLDFQRPDVPLTQEIARLLTGSLPCPVAVTLPYAENLSCPVFLPPPPLHMPLKNHLAPYAGREIWLELATEAARYIINKDRCAVTPTEALLLPEPVLEDQDAFCRYHIEIREDHAEFTLQRTEKELSQILSSDIGIAKGIGLYQQLKNMPVYD